MGNTSRTSVHAGAMADLVALAGYLRYGKRTASKKTKFVVLLAILAAFFAWWKARPVAHQNQHYTPSAIDENRSSAFTIRRGTSTAAEAAARKAAPHAKQAEEAIVKFKTQVVPGLGEGGLPAQLETEEENRLAMRNMETTEAFNKHLSDRISLDRSLPDVRHSLCKRDWNSASTVLPSVSVVVVFHNEARSTLLRTVHSVVRRSPAHLLREVILVDDFSDRDELQFELAYYLDTQFEGLVRLIRLHKRWGLVRARLIGAHAAKGEVLMFLDAHCEVTDQWLEPLLEHVHNDPHSIAVPMIDLIHADTLEYEPRDPEDFKVGGFSWDGHYKWTPVPPEEKLRRTTAANATRTPVMAGGLFAMNREYFWEIGSYDERMDLWGGENLEMSFRVWMCGGSIMLIPCSHVGHIFRKFSPYTLNKDSHGINTARVAYVWMDEYQRLFFLNRPDLRVSKILQSTALSTITTTHLPSLIHRRRRKSPMVYAGSVKSRVELRQRLQCNDFHWYLENVYPAKFVTDENVQAYGKVRPRGVDASMCLERLVRTHHSDKHTTEFSLGLVSCRGTNDPLTSQQIFALTLRGELRWDDYCAVPSNSTGVVLEHCMPDVNYEHQWEYTESSQLRHRSTDLCIEATKLEHAAEVSLSPCTENPYQIWSFENSFYLRTKRSLHERY